MGILASRSNVEDLRAKGYTFVTLECGGTAYPRVDIAISRLLP